MLFRCRSADRLDEMVETVVRTSLGSLRVACIVGAHPALDGENAAIVSSIGGGHHWDWKIGPAQAELPDLPAIPHMPDHLTVDDCWSALYRVEVTQDVRDAAFSCVWEPGYSWTDGDPDGGEGHLDWAYNDGRNVVSVSTEDELYLNYRAEHGDWLPRRLLPAVDYNSPVSILISSDSRRAASTCDYHPCSLASACIFSSRSPGRSWVRTFPTSWCVAAVRPSHILAGAGCDLISQEGEASA